ncbi:MAG: hypothetical protein PUJ51_02480 [Clostridiales bacterium]|uniref:hypothetical protein n=1 Tax=Terrisporobacter sp. TaxID=1965305 RepID=UPI002A58D0C1|nr:hypothetical protein [Terrisporobacter sp.]MDD7753360.1 hypothetical protein [Clostridiales bacterium]MDY4136802.1 hypothetical protein [Terrisporobacter sp.]
MNNRVLNVNDIENSIEIFGNEFELEFSENYINKLRSVDIKRIEENNVFEQLKELMNLILNDKEAYNKISKSYEEQKGKEFGLQAFIRVYEFIFNQYVEEMNNMNKKMSGMMKPNYQNREQRRNNYRGNKYRRY